MDDEAIIITHNQLINKTFNEEEIIIEPKSEKIIERIK